MVSPVRSTPLKCLASRLTGNLIPVVRVRRVPGTCHSARLETYNSHAEQEASNGEVRDFFAQTHHRWRRLFLGSPARMARGFGCGDERRFHFSMATTRQHPRASH